MDKKKNKQNKKVKKDDTKKYKVLYKHCKSISEQETARSNILEEKAGKLFIFYNIIIVFLFMVGKEILASEELENFLPIHILLLLVLILILYFVSKGMYFLIKVFTMQETKIPGLSKGAITFFENPKNDLIKMYKFNSESFFEIYEKAYENNNEKGKNIKKSYSYLEKSYVAILSFIIIKLIECVYGYLFIGSYFYL